MRKSCARGHSRAFHRGSSLPQSEATEARQLPASLGVARRLDTTLERERAGRNAPPRRRGSSCSLQRSPSPSRNSPSCRPEARLFVDPTWCVMYPLPGCPRTSVERGAGLRLKEAHKTRRLRAGRSRRAGNPEGAQHTAAFGSVSRGATRVRRAVHGARVAGGGEGAYLGRGTAAQDGTASTWTRQFPAAHSGSPTPAPRPSSWTARPCSAVPFPPRAPRSPSPGGALVRACERMRGRIEFKTVESKESNARRREQAWRCLVP